MAYPQTSGAAAPQKPSKTGIIWAIVIFAVTAIIGIVMIVVSIGTIANAIGDLQRVDAGETRQLSLGTGDQYVFVGADNRRDLLDVTVFVNDPDGDPVRLKGGNDYSSNNNGEQFESIGYIDVNQAGTYTVRVEGPPGSSARVGEIPIARFLGLLFGGIVIGGLGFVIAVVVLIVALVRRSRVKKANQTAAWGGPPPTAPYGQPLAPPAPPTYGTPAPPPAAPPAAPPATPPAAPTPPPPAAPTPPPPAAPPAPGSTPPPSPPSPTPPPPGSTPPPPSPGPTPPPPAPPG